MNETGEHSVQRNFDQLDRGEKVRAVLGGVREPVSKSFVLDVSGIDYDNLDEKDREEVDSIFTNKDV